MSNKHLFDSDRGPIEVMVNPKTGTITSATIKGNGRRYNMSTAERTAWEATVAKLPKATEKPLAKAKPAAKKKAAAKPKPKAKAKAKPRSKRAK